MTYAVVYSSKGNTLKLATAVKERLEGKDIIYFGMPDDKALIADVIYIGFWTNQGTCDDLTKEFIKKLDKQKVFLFGSAGFAKKEYLDNIINNVKGLLGKDVEVIDTFMCQGRMHTSVKEKYIAMKQNGFDSRKMDMLLENFEQALTHPSESDLDILKEKIK